MTAAVISPQRELRSAAEWIARDNPAAAQAFRNAVGRAAERIGNHPEIGAHRPELARVTYRFLGVAGYPYLIVYAADRSPPVVASIVHTARDLPRALRDLQ